MSEEIIQGAAGTIGSVAAMALTYPLLTLSTRQQVSQNKKTLTLLKELIFKEGWQQLYSGLTTSLLATALSMGIFTYSYEKLKQLALTQQLPKQISSTSLPSSTSSLTLSTSSNLLIGFIAGAINTTITTPFWVIVTRMQANKNTKSLRQVISEIWRESNFRGFFKGWQASIVLCSNPAIQWMVYEQLSLLMKKTMNVDKLNALHIFVIGAIAKIIATLITYPYIVVKSRMQASSSPNIQNNKNDNNKKENNKNNNKNNKNNNKNKKDDNNNEENENRICYEYSGIFDAFWKITKKEGFGGLYSGLNSKITQSVLNSAFMFLFKEQFVILAVFLISLRKSPLPLPPPS